MLCAAGRESPPPPKSPAEPGAGVSRNPPPAHSILPKSVSPRLPTTQRYKR